MANDIGGVWRTIGGRRVFIKDGDDLETAMRKSGKFKIEKKKEEEIDDPRNAIAYYLKKGEFEKAEQYMKDYGLEDEKEMFIEGLNYKVQKDYKDYLKSKMDNEIQSEYELSKISNSYKERQQLSALEKSEISLRYIDRLSDEAQHYTNDFSLKRLEEEGRKMGSKDFENYVNKLKSNSYANRNNYTKGDIIEYDANHLGVNPRWHQGEVLSVERGLATHGYTRADNVYKVEDETGRQYKIDATAITKRIRRK